MLPYARMFASRSMAFVLAVLGVITQIFHNIFLAWEVSAFTSFSRYVVTTLIAFVISSTLLYYTLLSDPEKETDYKRENFIKLFFGFEVYINIMYYAFKLFMKEYQNFGDMCNNADWTRMFIALPFAIMIPYTIKMYAGEIKVNIPEEGEEIYMDEELSDKLRKVSEKVEKVDNDALNLKSSIREVNNIVDDMNEGLNVKIGELNAEVMKIGSDTKGLIRRVEWLKRGRKRSKSVILKFRNKNNGEEIEPLEAEMFLKDSNNHINRHK